MAVVTGAAGNAISSAVIVPLFEELFQIVGDAFRLEENRQVLKSQIDNMKRVIGNINDQFRDQQRMPSQLLQQSLNTVLNEIDKGQRLIDSSYWSWCKKSDCKLCKPKIWRNIRVWKETFPKLYKQLQSDFCFAYFLEETARRGRHRKDAYLHEQPRTRLIGCNIDSYKEKLMGWIKKASINDEIGTYGVFGMGGAGKSALLKLTYNTFKVGNDFDYVFWVEVGQNPNLADLQMCIAYTCYLDRGSIKELRSKNVTMRKMLLSAYMREKKIPMFLDDLWRSFNLDELGIAFVNKKESSVVFSTRNGNLIREMKAKDSIEVTPLTDEEASELFFITAFGNSGTITEDIKKIGTQIAGTCKGLPLAICVLATAMRGRSVDDLSLALRQMETVDSNVRVNYPNIDQDLYKPLRLSYDNLPRPKKDCFLYCAMFPKGAVIDVGELVNMLVAEGLVEANAPDILSSTGKRYIQDLVDNCLLQSRDPRDGPVVQITVHGVLCELAIHIGENDENCVLKAGQELKEFPRIRNNSKRISVCCNSITSLPQRDLGCPTLMSLIMRENATLKEIPDNFLRNLASLKVLDISETNIKMLPETLWELIQLRYLNVSNTKIKEVPEDICKLCELEFLYLKKCSELKSLPSKIGQLEHLKILNIVESRSITELPEIVGRPNFRFVHS